MNRYCEDNYNKLCQEDPKLLADLMQDPNIKPEDLTFAAEILGQCGNIKLIRETILPLLDHKESVVREGALYGIYYAIDDQIAEKIKEMSLTDKSEAIRTISKETLDEFENYE